MEESITAVAKKALVDRGYPGTMYEFVEAFPGTMTKLSRTLIAMGFSFDDGGEQGEIGSDLRHRVYTVEFFVFGLTNTQGRNFANVLKFALDNGSDGYGGIALLDVSQVPPVRIDTIIVRAVHAQRVPIQDPEPWQQFTWTTTVTVEDWYSAAAA